MNRWSRSVCFWRRIKPFEYRITNIQHLTNELNFEKLDIGYSIFKKVKKNIKIKYLPNQFLSQPVLPSITAKNIKQAKSYLN